MTRLSKYSVEQLRNFYNDVLDLIGKIHSKEELEFGICANLEEWEGELYELFKTWGKFSGCVLYPVPMPFTSWLPEGKLKRFLAEVYYKRSNKRFTGLGKRLRLHLLNHILRKIVDEILKREHADNVKIDTYV